MKHTRLGIGLIAIALFALPWAMNISHFHFGVASARANAAIEIDENDIDDDGDGMIDEMNTLDENGANPAYSALDPTDKDNFFSSVKSFSGYENNTVLVRFNDNSVYQYTVFTDDTSYDTTVRRYKRTSYLVVLSGDGNEIALLNPFNGIVSGDTMISDTEYTDSGMKQWNLRRDEGDKTIEVIVTAKNDDETRVSIIRVNVGDATLTLASTDTVSETNVNVDKTKVRSHWIVLRVGILQPKVIFYVNDDYELERA
ncbi:MAG: hypothetical protein HYV32_03965 [Candidatus Kerfeldbacteria bacterium]|nr:hypothetical protein [Candidatus Kerfeldbacteria bacterium]